MNVQNNQNDENDSNLLYQSLIVETININETQQNQHWERIGNTNYQINKQIIIGRGAFGEVYEGKFIDINQVDQEYKDVQQLAIKRMIFFEDSSSNQNQIKNKALFAELKILQELKKDKNDNFVKVIDFYWSELQGPQQSRNKTLYIIMEQCNQGDLSYYIKTNPFNKQKVFHMFDQLINGFRYFRQKQLIHRDLKPSNILLHDQKIKICDFGSAKRFTDVGNIELTINVGGTISYMAPEFEGILSTSKNEEIQYEKYDEKVDVYSLGIVFFEMIYKKVPLATEKAQKLQNELKQNKTDIQKHKDFPFFPEQGSEDIEQCIKDFIKHLVQFDQKDRLYFKQVFDIWDQMFLNKTTFQIRGIDVSKLVSESNLDFKKQQILKKNYSNEEIFQKAQHILNYYQHQQNLCSFFYVAIKQTKQIVEQMNTKYHYLKIDKVEFYKLMIILLKFLLLITELLIDQITNENNNTGQPQEYFQCFLINEKYCKETLQNLKNVQKIYSNSYENIEKAINQFLDKDKKLILKENLNFSVYIQQDQIKIMQEFESQIKEILRQFYKSHWGEFLKFQHEILQYIEMLFVALTFKQTLKFDSQNPEKIKQFFDIQKQQKSKVVLQYKIYLSYQKIFNNNI